MPCHADRALSPSNVYKLALKPWPSVSSAQPAEAADNTSAASARGSFNLLGKPGGRPHHLKQQNQVRMSAIYLSITGLRVIKAHPEP